MAATKIVKEYYTKDTTEWDVLEQLLFDCSLSDESTWKDPDYPKGFKITITVEEISE